MGGWGVAREFRAQAGDHLPELAFVSGGVLAEFACAFRVVEGDAPVHFFERTGITRFAHPPPTPPFQGGELRGNARLPRWFCSATEEARR